MKKQLSILLALFICAFAFAQQPEEKSLTTRFNLSTLKEILTSKDNFKPYPLCGDSKWQNMPDSLRKKYINDAESLLGTHWSALPMNLFMEFKTPGNGNRTHYEREIFLQRDKLTTLVVAELLENKGRFMTDIVNGVWAICEESWWGIPAHYPGNLPNVQQAQENVELFVAETGGFMSWVYYLMQDKFDKISPEINTRICFEIKRRLIDPCLKNNYSWMSAKMNWNPWICSNWMTAVLIVEKDPEQRAAGIEKILKSLDTFIDGYPADGGCDEGPGYWDRAGASLFECLNLLSLATQNKINLSQHPKVVAMGQFIYKAFIGDKYFVNFADARTDVEPNISIVYRYGKYIQDQNMMQFASYWAKKLQLGSTPVTTLKNRLDGKADVTTPFFVGLSRMLPLFLSLDQILTGSATATLAPDYFLPNLQVMFARSKEGSTDNFYLAAKGGHNDESHNHNDVGNYIVYYDAQPILIDAGVGSYTSKTFDNSQRYKIWTMQSGYHNLPTINGEDQSYGRKFAAKDVIFRSTTRKSTLSMDIAGAYPTSAGVKRWKREVSLYRLKKIKVSESYLLTECKQAPVLNLLTACEATIQPDGNVILKNKSQEFELAIDAKKWKAEIEIIPLDDVRLSAVWGNHLTRIRFKSTSTELSGSASYTISLKK